MGWIFFHLTATAGAPLIPKAGGKRDTGSSTKESGIYVKSLFLMDPQEPIYLYIVPLVPCAVTMQIQV